MDTTRDYINKLRNEFTIYVLNEKTVSSSPFRQFDAWMKEAIDSKVNEPNAMTLATSKSGHADARIVLLRDYSPKGFTFFSNYRSIKGKEIRHSKNVCMNFFWPELQRQVRIQGTIDFLPAKASDKYFASRPRESQVAAWASNQSEGIKSRKELEERFEYYERKFTDGKVPRPEHWGGYIIQPVHFEFWQGRANRLHDRIVYDLDKKSKWKISRLNP